MEYTALLEAYFIGTATVLCLRYFEYRHPHRILEVFLAPVILVYVLLRDTWRWMFTDPVGDYHGRDYDDEREDPPFRGVDNPYAVAGQGIPDPDLYEDPFRGPRC